MKTLSRREVEIIVEKRLNCSNVILTDEEKERVIDYEHWSMTNCMVGTGCVGTTDEDVNQGRQIWKEKCEDAWADYLEKLYS